MGPSVGFPEDQSDVLRDSLTFTFRVKYFPVIPEDQSNITLANGKTYMTQTISTEIQRAFTELI